MKDPTEQQRLIENETRFCSVIDAVPDAVVGCLRGRTIAGIWNKGAEKVFGYTKEEAIGKPLSLIIPDRLRKEHEEGVDRFVRSGSAAYLGKTAELTATRKGGEEFPIEISLGSWKQEEEGIFFVAVIRDITDRKRAEEELKEARAQLEGNIERRTSELAEANERLREEIFDRAKAETQLRRVSRQDELLLNSVGEGIYGNDLKGMATFVNPAAARMLGWEVDELLGKHVHEIFHHTKPDGSPYPSSECQAYAVFEDGLPRHVEGEYFWRKDGSHFEVEYLSTPIKERGKVVGSVVVFRDVTEHKRAEQELKFRSLLLSSVSDSVFVLNTEGRLLFVNEMAYKARGYTRDELLALPLSKIDAPEYEEAARERIRELLEKGSSVFETVHLRKDGSRMSVEVRANLIDYAGEKVIVATAIDLTERKRTQELERSYELERRIAKTLQEGLIQPLHVISGLEIGIAYASALGTAKVGGDFYDAFEVGEGKVVIVLGDVSGKSVEAAVLTASVRSTIRAVAQTNFFPSFILERTNESIIRQIEPDTFVTVVVMMLDLKSGAFVYANAGHLPPIICSRECRYLREIKHGVPIGTFQVHYEDFVGALDEGDMLLFFTDGLVEAAKDKELFGFDRVLDVLAGHGRASCQSVADALLEAATEFSGYKLRDDVAILTLRRNPGWTG